MPLAFQPIDFNLPSCNLSQNLATLTLYNEAWSEVRFQGHKPIADFIMSVFTVNNLAQRFALNADVVSDIMRSMEFWALWSQKTIPEEPILPIEERERIFNEAIRRFVVTMFFFLGVYLFSFFTLKKFKMRYECEPLYVGYEDWEVFRINTWICAVALTVSICSCTLLPITICSAELLHQFPDNYYLQWLSWPLVHLIWNCIFFMSNVSVFLLLPFAYFIMETLGYTERYVRQSLMQRSTETFTVLGFVAFFIWTLFEVFYQMFFPASHSPVLIMFHQTSSYVPFNVSLMYSCLSLFGSISLLILTPMGYSRMFTLVCDKLSTMKPTQYQPIQQVDPDEEFIKHLDNLAERTQHPDFCKHIRTLQDNRRKSIQLKKEISRSSFMTLHLCAFWQRIRKRFSLVKNRTFQEVHIRWTEIITRMLIKTRSGIYPTCIITLVILTSVTLLMVSVNILQLAFGFRSLPTYIQVIEARGRHRFGIIGLCIEITVILYVMVASIIGLYSIPFMRTIMPKLKNTTMTSLIINCTAYVLLSSALPVLMVTLGLTSFDLLGYFGSIQWLSSFYIVLGCNLIFAGILVFILSRQLSNRYLKAYIKFARDKVIEWFEVDEAVEAAWQNMPLE